MPWLFDGVPKRITVFVGRRFANRETQQVVIHSGPGRRHRTRLKDALLRLFHRPSISLMRT